MKVLLVITKSEIGGAQVFVLNLAKELKKKGVDVTVAAGEGGYLFDELEKHNIQYYYLKSLKRDVNLFNALYFVCDIYRLLKKYKFQIIHLNSTNTLLSTISTFFLKYKPKIVFTFHGLSLLDKNYQSHRIFKFITKYYFKALSGLLDASVFVSEINFKEAIRYKIVSSGEVIYNGLAEEEMEYLSKKQAIEFFSKLCKYNFDGCFIIGSTGRLSYQKNYDFLIDNFAIVKKYIPTLKIIIIGDGPFGAQYKKKIENMGFEKDFFLVGAIKESYKYIKAFDLFVLPSRYEGLSISLLEALFAGLPILTTDVGGNPEIINNDFRQLYKLNNLNEFMEKLLFIKENKEEIIRYNLSLKSKFGLNVMTEKYMNIYKRLLNQ
ncbi:glycosyltransferase [Melioribacter sp. OK-6-Me]|uniref:glycosyltransferase n=1 Tax=unclassified Melioribacter TaxID=2627329 RepID=UPI003EDA4CDC